VDRKKKELTAEEILWITQSAAKGESICYFYNKEPKELLTPTILDKAFKAWKEDSRSNKFTNAEIINGLGCLFG
jgi:hypothetical protein